MAQSVHLFRLRHAHHRHRPVRRENDRPLRLRPARYWLIDTKYGGAFGFNTETSPGPAVRRPAACANFFPPDQLWPQDQSGISTPARKASKDLTLFNTAMDAIYGAPKNLDDYALKSQAMAYEGERAMFEATPATSTPPPASFSGCSITLGPPPSGTSSITICSPPEVTSAPKRPVNPSTSSILTTTTASPSSTAVRKGRWPHPHRETLRRGMHERFSKQTQVDVDPTG